jgi:hypothetical protein
VRWRKDAFVLKAAYDDSGRDLQAAGEGEDVFLSYETIGKGAAHLGGGDEHFCCEAVGFTLSIVVRRVV